MLTENAEVKLGKGGLELLETAAGLAGGKQQNWLVHDLKKEDGYQELLCGFCHVGFDNMALGVDQVLCLELPGVDGQVLLAEVHLQWCFCPDSSATGTG